MTTPNSNRQARGAAKRIFAVMAPFLFATALLAQPQIASVITNGLNEPAYITSDPNNNIYFTDASANRIVEFIPITNGLITLAGSGTTQFGYSNSIYGSLAQFSQPLGIVYDSYRGGLVVVDQANQVLRFVTLGGAVSTLAGVPASQFNTDGGTNDGTAATAQFAYPVGIATDGAGNLYVADTGNNAIRRVNSTNGVTTVQVTNYTFNAPNAVAVDNNNNLWVADTLNNTICIISNISVIVNQKAYVVGGAPGAPGTNDSVFSALARFNKPSGLLWDPNGAGLLITDTGNDTIRRLYPNTLQGGWSVQTVAGLPGIAGHLDGSIATATLNAPRGITVDAVNNGYYFTDRGSSELRRYQTGAPLPPVTDPQIGLVSFQVNPATSQLTSVFSALPNGGIFHTNNIISIYNSDSDPNVQTYYILTNTPVNQFINTPVPTTNSTFAPNYPGDGSPPTSTDSVSLFPPQPVPVTLYAISLARGRAPSHVVSANFQYIAAPPIIGGNNGALVQLTELTSPATMWYTIDGSTPAVNGPTSIGPVASGTNISFNVVSNVTLSVEAFAPGFAPSQVATALFTVSNFMANQITFGFAANEASSEFVGAAGQRFYAPVTLSLLPGATMYSLQFNATVTNNPGAPAVGQTYKFDSMLVKPVQVGGGTVYVVIPPEFVTGLGFTSGLFTNASANLLGVGWFEIRNATNLYNAAANDLISFSLAHENLFLSTAGSVVVGSYSFVIPPAAPLGSSYQIQLGRPSADGDGFSQNVLIQTPTNGALGQGAVNSIKNVTVGVRPYLVGDVAPFRWFNAGDFGDSNLLNNDVLETFRAAVYVVNVPLPGSDFFDAMDSSDGSDPNYLNGNDTTINNIMFGDGQLDVSDIYVTLRRSLDHTLTDYERYWSNGTLHAQAVPNIFNPGIAAKSARRANAQAAGAAPHPIVVAADRVFGTGGQTVQIPVRVLAADSLPITVMALNVDVVPLDGSPGIVTPVSFSAANGLGASFATLSQGADNFAGAWLNSTSNGVAGTNVLGTLFVTLPAGANANSSYLVHFEHFSASPNGIGVFKSTVQDGLITGASRSASSWNDGIPDWWRLVYFGTVSNLLSAANLDADGDGASNWQEYVAGTNPMDAASVLQLTPVPPAGGFTVQWPSVVGKSYVVQCSSSLFSTNWATIISNIPGTGQTMQLSDTNGSGPPARFYRVQVQ